MLPLFFLSLLPPLVARHRLSTLFVSLYFCVFFLWRSQMTCLMLAARDGYSKVINLLVSHGADMNVQDGNGYTVCNFCFLNMSWVRSFRLWYGLYDLCQALSVAVQYGREEAVLKLLQLGADKTIRTNAGKSPTDLATVFKHIQVNKTFLSLEFVSLNCKKGF